MNNNTNSPWNGRRYYPISQYFKARFGERVGKVSVSVAEQCPNRRKDKTGESAGACIFCDEWGSAAYHLEKDRDLADQIRHNKKNVQRRLKNKKFLVYFQSYTNTLDKIGVLKRRFETALAEDGVHGLVVGTRPDCLPERLYPLFNDVSQETYLLIELGVQSFYDEHLDFLKRGHSAKKSMEAIHNLAAKTDADIGIHLMFGLPNESDEMITETAKRINTLPISNVKLHNLHVLKNTPLATMYAAGLFTPVELEKYAGKVILFLRHLSPTIAVQRLAAIANRWDELVAPEWTRQKMPPIEYIEKQMALNGYLQGDLVMATNNIQR